MSTPDADLVTTSLTKWFSGMGDVMAGSLIISRTSPLHDRLRHALVAEPADALWCADAVVLERNSRDFPERMARIDLTTDAMREFLKGHASIERVWHPRDETPELYKALRRPKVDTADSYPSSRRIPRRPPPGSMMRGKSTRGQAWERTSR